MKALLDTNIIIHRENNRVSNKGIGELYYWLDKLNIEKVDLSGLLQNLLDNAIEECCRISEDFERKILWTMNTTEYGVKIRVENTCCNIKNIDFITKKEDKNAHGWGVKIIKEVVQKAGGNINYTKEEGNNICAEVFLPFIGNF